MAITYIDHVPHIDHQSLAATIVEHLRTEGITYDASAIRRQLRGATPTVPEIVERAMREILQRTLPNPSPEDRGDQADTARLPPLLYLPPFAAINALSLAITAKASAT